MSIDRIGIRPAENGFIVNVCSRDESKRKGGPTDYREKDKIATSAGDVLKLVSDALGKSDKKGRGLRVRAGRSSDEGAAKVRGKKKSGSKKKMAFKR